MSERDQSCEKRIGLNLENRIADLRRILNGEHDTEDETEDLDDYGLCFDYVSASTFHDQKEAYFRYQLS